MLVAGLPVPESRGRRECAGTRSRPPHRHAPPLPPTATAAALRARRRLPTSPATPTPSQT